MNNPLLVKEMQVAMYGQQLKKAKKSYKILRFLMYFSGIVGIWIGLTGIDFCLKGHWGFGIFDLALMTWNLWNARVNSKQSHELKAIITDLEQELEKANAVA
jgi:hypothetical protein